MMFRCFQWRRTLSPTIEESRGKEDEEEETTDYFKVQLLNVTIISRSEETIA